MKKNIKISSVVDATTLVKIATNVDGDVIISKGRYNIDGKSIMGVFSIDLSTGVIIEYPESATELDEFIQSFVI